MIGRINDRIQEIILGAEKGGPVQTLDDQCIHHRVFECATWKQCFVRALHSAPCVLTGMTFLQHLVRFCTVAVRFGAVDQPGKADAEAIIFVVARHAIVKTVFTLLRSARCGIPECSVKLVFRRSPTDVRAAHDIDVIARRRRSRFRHQWSRYWQRNGFCRDRFGSRGRVSRF